MLLRNHVAPIRESETEKDDAPDTPPQRLSMSALGDDGQAGVRQESLEQTVAVAHKHLKQREEDRARQQRPPFIRPHRRRVDVCIVTMALEICVKMVI